MKKVLTALLAAFALLVGGIVAASPASAVTYYRIQSQSNSTCSIQYRSGPTSTIYSVYPGNLTPSTRNAAYFRIPAGCNGYVQEGTAVMNLNPTTWYATVNYTSGGGGTITYVSSFKN